MLQNVACRTDLKFLGRFAEVLTISPMFQCSKMVKKYQPYQPKTNHLGNKSHVNTVRKIRVILVTVETTCFGPGPIPYGAYTVEEPNIFNEQLHLSQNLGDIYVKVGLAHLPTHQTQTISKPLTTSSSTKHRDRYAT